MDMKVCNRCGKELPLTSEYFRVCNTCKDGFRGQCRECENKQGKQYKKDNKERVAEYQKQYKIDKKEYLAKYKKDNKEHAKVINKLYDIKNKEKIAIRKKLYRETNKEAIRIRSEIYYQNNKESIANKIKLYSQNNKEKTRLKKQNYRARKNALPSTLTIEQWETIKQHFNNRCAYCGKEEPLAQEHFIALSKGGEYASNNIIPSCKSCNCSKLDKDFFEWYPKYKNYSKKREQKILDYLGYKDGIQQLSISI